MKLSCQIVQDLLPLVDDGVCSEDSKRAVSEHLDTCDACRKMANHMHGLGEEILLCEAKVEDAVIHKGLKRIRRRWLISVVAVLMIVPIILFGTMVRNETKAEGICFSNLDELHACEEYLDAIADGDLSVAADCINFSSYYDEIQEALALRPSDYMPSFVPTQIDGQSYMVIMGALQEHLHTGDFWVAALNACDAQVPIPLDVWEKIGSEQLVQNGICYLPYETKWGTFMLVDTMYEMLTEQESPKLYDHFVIMPSDMYAELLPQMQEKAQEYYEDTQNRLEAVKDMDADAFAEFMRSDYAEKLENGVQVEEFEYQNAFYSLGKWNIRYEAKIAFNGERHRIKFEFYAKDGEISHLYAINVENDEYLTRILDRYSPRIG